MGKLIDLTGKRFGKWKVNGREESGVRGVTRWFCKCDCGTTRSVEASSLRDGQSTNCGCEPKVFKHGMSTTMEYHSWSSMRNRCARGKPGYENVSVCARWLADDGFLNFLEDMGPRPRGTTLDRKKNSEGYCKENCQWSTPRAQNMNRRNSRIVLLDGRPVTLDFAHDLMSRRMRRGERQYTITTVLPGSVT